MLSLINITVFCEYEQILILIAATQPKKFGTETK